MPDAPPPPVPPFPFTPTFDGIPFPTGPIDLARRPRRANYVFSFEERGENRAELMATYTVISWLRRRFREVDMRPISPTALAWDLRTPWVTPALVNGVLSRLLAQSHAGAGNTVLVGEETIYTFRDPCEIEAPWTEEDASAALRTAHRLPDLPMDELLGGKGLPMWARRLRAVVQDTADPAVDVDKAVRAFYGLLGGDLFEGVVPWDMRVRAMLTTLQEQIVAKGFDAVGEVGAARFVLPFSREGVRGFGWLGELVARLGWPAFTDVGLAGAKQHPELVAPCRKCKTGRARAHHRRCPKRGLGQLGREARVRKLEARALDAGLDLHVRRGRHGTGVSEDVAYRLVLGQYTVRASGSPAAIQQRVAGMLSLSPEWVTVGRGAPGEVRVSIDARLGAEKLDAIERELRETLPAHLLILVRGIDSTAGNTILPA